MAAPVFDPVALTVWILSEPPGGVCEDVCARGASVGPTLVHKSEINTQINVFKRLLKCFSPDVKLRAF